MRFDHPVGNTPVFLYNAWLTSLRQNDLLSYRKDIIKGEESNIIFILKDQGLTDQQAVDQIGEMLYDCYRRWHTALTEIPFWGEVIDRDVMKFVNGCRNIALGNLHWRYIYSLLTSFAHQSRD
jgi:hypothetical protein